MKSARQIEILSIIQSVDVETQEQLLSELKKRGFSATQATISAIREEVYGINATLPTATAIRKFYFTRDELAPPTAVKVSRTQLQKKIEAGEVSLVPFSECAAMNADEENSPLMLDVRKIIAKVLELPEERVEPGSHIFFDLGASSIQYFSILSALGQHFSISGYEKNDKYCYTPKEICEYIENVSNLQLLESYIHYFYDETEFVWDYMDKGIVMLDDPERIFEIIETRQSELKEDFKVLLERGEVVPKDACLITGFNDLY